ncbi:MAG: hypothetical protein PVH61_01270 [Candidatus Aminicenantes bacterium]|jgi:ketosteroid isomerase-like protein
MKNKKFSFSLTLTVFFVTILLAFNPVSGEEQQKVLTKKELIAKVQGIREGLNKALIEGNMKSQMAYLTDDFISMEPNREIAKGREAYWENSKRLMKSGVKIKSASNEIIDIWMSGDMVYEMGTFNLKIAFPNSAVPAADEGKYFAIWQVQKDGSFKVKYSIWNTNRPIQQMKAESKVKMKR